MYIQCTHGFVEADRWDGQTIPLRTHQTAAKRVKARSASQTVVVLRSREEATLVALVASLAPDRGVFHAKRLQGRKVYRSPQGWDYEFRAYVTAEEWGQILTKVALDLDYRNFKSWCTKNKPQDHKLAHDIWHAAHDAGVAKQRSNRWSDLGGTAWWATGGRP